MNKKQAMPKYYQVGDLRKVICTTQRAGSTSMIESMAPAYAGSRCIRIEPSEVLSLRKADWPVLLWLRDPLERFASAYAIFSKGRIPAAKTQLKYRTAALFADLVFMQEDAHWSPMTRLHTFGGVFLPTRVHPFYNLVETWAEEMPGYHLALLNETKRKSWSQLTEELNANYVTMICKHYEEDIKMLDWCNEYGVMEAAA